MEDYALGQETGREVIKNGEYTVSDDGSIYKYRYDTYYGVGFGRYRIITLEEYKDIQRYQDETGRQVLYPTVRLSARPQLVQDKDRADIYYKTKVVSGKTQPALDVNGKLVLNYWKYSAADGEPSTAAPYTSK